MKEVQEMKRIHQRFAKKRQMEREALLNRCNRYDVVATQRKQSKGAQVQLLHWQRTCTEMFYQ